ncbi:uncharacterized protein ACN427_008651 [Glossina fuscipes fuscipes]
MPYEQYLSMVSYNAMVSFMNRQIKYVLVPHKIEDRDVPLHVVNGYILQKHFELPPAQTENYIRLASQHPGGYYLHLIKYAKKKGHINNLIAGVIGFFELKPITYGRGRSAPTYYSLIPLSLHDNATEAYPSVNPNPNAWEFLQNIGYYQYGAYFNISEFWHRVVTFAMDRHYQEGEQRTFYIPTNDAFKGNIKRYHVNGTTILRNIVEEALVFRVGNQSLPKNQTYRTMAWGKGHPTLVQHDKDRLNYCWYDMQESTTCKTNKAQILHSVFVSNGVVTFIDKIMGLNDTIAKNKCRVPLLRISGVEQNVIASIEL